jgi:hypothetical protein
VLGVLLIAGLLVNRVVSGVSRLLASQQAAAAPRRRGHPNHWSTGRPVTGALIRRPRHEPGGVVRVVAPDGTVLTAFGKAPDGTVVTYTRRSSRRRRLGDA